MGRKKGKRQSDPSRDDAESTDTEIDDGHEGVVHVACPHVGKAVQLANIKKSLKVAWVRVGQCSLCFKEQQSKSPSNIHLKRVKNEVLRREFGGKLSTQEIKRLQLERAKEERKAAADKLRKMSESTGIENSVNKNNEVNAAADEVKKTEDEKKEGNLPGGDTDVPSCWLCMRCGSQGCDNNTKKHSFGHYKAPRSDLHCLIVNTENWVIWCYECQTEINVDTHKKLYEVVELVKKIRDQPVGTNTKAMPKPALGTAAIIPYSGTGSLKPAATSSNVSAKSSSSNINKSFVLPRVKGLSNLGNTCFFNSVMQCLSQTHPLTDLIDSQVSQGVNFSISGTCLSFPEDSEPEGSSASTTMKMLDVYSDLSVKLAEGGPMLTSLAAFFRDILGGGKSSVINPGHLFSQVARQSPKFRGMQQQDSHELLRYLMDGLKNEESKRQKSAVLKYFGLNEKSDPKSVPNHLKRKIQAYGRESNHCLFDKIFSGQMVSTIVCEECHHSSHTYEQFLDLSLPVVEDKPSKPPKNLHKRQSGILISDDGQSQGSLQSNHRKRSKAQTKKERARLKKESRAKRFGKSPKEVSEGPNEEEGNDDEKKIKEELEGTDVQKSSEVNSAEENEGKGDDTMESHEKQFSNEEDSSKVTDGDNEEDETQPDINGDGDWEWDYGEPWEDKQALVFKAKIRDSQDSIDDISENIDADLNVDDQPAVQLVSIKSLSESDLDHEPSSERVCLSEDEETGASSNGDIEDNDTAEEKDKWVMSKNLLNNLQKLDNLMNTSENCDPRMFELCKSMSNLKMEERRNEKEKMRVEWTSRTLKTLAPRYQTSSDECSVYSCLNNFTQSELLTGHNKWACDSCTQIKKANLEENSDSDRKTETVYSPASKQFLIFCPPAILTLHLKRFQQTLSGLKKVNKHVSFPLVLDLASYCSSTSLAMPNISIGQSSVLYSLYGVVEHSGGLQGGHYTAFVKVRPSDTFTDPSSFFSPSLSKASDIPKFLEEIESKVQSANHNKEDNCKEKTLETCSSQSKRWYHVSDSSVSEATEERVLKCQAYILFYERIL